MILKNAPNCDQQGCQVLYFGTIFSCMSLKDTYCLSRMAENVLRLAINDVTSGLLGDDQSLFTVAFLQTTAIVCHGLEALLGQLLGHHAKINIADPLFVQFVITACCMIEQVSKLLKSYYRVPFVIPFLEIIKIV